MKKLLIGLCLLLIAAAAEATPTPTSTPTPAPTPVVFPHKWIGLTDNQGHTAVINPDGTLPFSTTSSGTNPTGPAGGVLGGTYPNPDFNSTNTAGNTMNNAFIVNNQSTNANATDLRVLFNASNVGSCATIGLGTFDLNDPENIESCPGSVTGKEMDLGVGNSTCSTFLTFTTTDYDGLAAPFQGVAFFSNSCSGQQHNDVLIDGGGLGMNEDHAGMSPIGRASWAYIYDDVTTHLLTANVNNGGAKKVILDGMKGTLFASGTAAATDSATVGCTDTDVTVASVTTAMSCLVNPQGAPSGTGSGNITWMCYPSAGKITIRLCTIVVVTAAATTYNYEVFN